MKAMLLAGGLGTRLRPLTDHCPKCLVEVAGRPLLSWWFDLLEREDVDEVVINLHHHAPMVRAFIEGYKGELRIVPFFEPRLLGSAGTLAACREQFEREERFYILYGDNLTNASLQPLLEHNRRYPAALTVGTFRAPNPSACGIFEVASGPDGRALSFVEKPIDPLSNKASAGLFVAGREFYPLLDRVRDAEEFDPFDVGRHVMPRAIDQMNCVDVAGYLRDIGTPESLAAADIEFPKVLGGRF